MRREDQRALRCPKDVDMAGQPVQAIRVEHARRRDFAQQRSDQFRGFRSQWNPGAHHQSLLAFRGAK